MSTATRPHPQPQYARLYDEARHRGVRPRLAHTKTGPLIRYTLTIGTAEADALADRADALDRAAIACQHQLGWPA